MNVRLDTIQEILRQLEDFAKIGDPTDLAAFGRYLDHQSSDYEKVVDHAAAHRSIEIQILKNIGELTIHYNRYIKMLLHLGALKRWNDLLFIMILDNTGSLSKSELIRRALMSTSSGIEIINRLLKYGYITESRSKKDGRAKLVKLTPAGKHQLRLVQSEMDDTADLVVSPLSESERHQLLKMLLTINTLHRSSFEKS